MAAVGIVGPPPRLIGGSAWGCRWVRGGAGVWAGSYWAAGGAGAEGWVVGGMKVTARPKMMSSTQGVLHCGLHCLGHHDSLLLLHLQYPL